MDSQYGFTTQESTRDADMEAKYFIGPELKKEILLITSLDGKSTFNKAKSLKGLEKCRMP